MAVILSALSLCLHIMVSFCVESVIVSQHSGIYINICCHYITHMPDRNCLAILLLLSLLFRVVIVVVVVVVAFVCYLIKIVRSLSGWG